MKTYFSTFTTDTRGIIEEMVLVGRSAERSGAVGAESYHIIGA